MRSVLHKLALSGLVLSAWVVLAVLLAACGGSTDGSSEPSEPLATQTPPTSVSTTENPSTSNPPTTAAIPEDAVALDQLVIVGVDFGDDGFVSVQNRASTDADVNGIYICQFPEYTDLGGVVAGGVIAAGATVEVPASVVGGLVFEGGEAALYANANDFGSADNIFAYVQWGSGGARAEVAAAANIWPGADVSVIPDPSYNNIELEGDPVDPENWS